jgi:hypothetical protein
MAGSAMLALLSYEQCGLGGDSAVPRLSGSSAGGSVEVQKLQPREMATAGNPAPTSTGQRYLPPEQ